MKSIAITKYTFAVIGLAMLAFALYSANQTKRFLATAAQANGTVVGVHTVHSRKSMKHRPIVEFKASNGETITFEGRTLSSSSHYAKGDQAVVLYDPTHPHTAKLDDFMSLWGMSAIVGLIGGIFFSIGGGIILAGVLTDRREEYLRNQGMPVSANFLRVDLNRAVKVNGRNPFRIVTQWKDPTTSTLHTFKSRNLWTDPTPHIKTKTLTVYIDPTKPKKYFVDLSFLPKAG